MITNILAEAKDKMEKSLEATKDDFASVRTGRANPGLFQKIMVDYYGTMTPLGQLGAISTPEARTILINPYDKSALGAIEKALMAMPNLGAQPNSDGNVIRVNLPELTEERRKEYVKLTRDKAEHGRVSIRNIRRKGMEDLASVKKDGGAGEDEVERGEKELEATTKTHIERIDEALKNKESELLEV
ncbi:ribosome recycling factor [Candidatus Aquiluna sp. UB-MaderosW2red]|jgi:ribosome recycling factor|uniref:ribosome recycling factor n=1 Tax=Candidatus Aquiluna sp. UB-MaderosW2red TaxID=1855377 RepID=UPI000875B563|nr:ribosome recycling factor [Candidatus Aquiluna sp. UB-MaderosW2red]SCX09619.1 ribosome recycling factor [Candidatus Aquiluna sp. UB-MaderosW2red]